MIKNQTKIDLTAKLTHFNMSSDVAHFPYVTTTSQVYDQYAREYEAYTRMKMDHDSCGEL